MIHRRGRMARWYAKFPGVFADALEVALASDTPLRRTLAWTIILQTGGGKEGSVAEFAEVSGLTHQSLSHWLRGEREIRPSTAQKIADAMEINVAHLYRWGHPLSIDVGVAPLEPGDPQWPEAWEMMREHAKTVARKTRFKSPQEMYLLSAEEVKNKFHFLFEPRRRS